jgi:uncharacterized protein YqeY
MRYKAPMPIAELVSEQLKAAMRAQDKPRLAALRNIRAALLNAMKEDGSETLSDEASVAVLRRLAKQRAESIEAFEAGGRPEKAAAERAELALIESFLPQLADEGTTRAWVAEAIAACKASSPRELGRVMGALMKAHKDEVDGSLARRLATELLGG